MECGTPVDPISVPNDFGVHIADARSPLARLAACRHCTQPAAIEACHRPHTGDWFETNNPLSHMA